MNHTSIPILSAEEKEYIEARLALHPQCLIDELDDYFLKNRKDYLNCVFRSKSIEGIFELEMYIDIIFTDLIEKTCEFCIATLHINMIENGWTEKHNVYVDISGFDVVLPTRIRPNELMSKI